jgi:hypothetical protein
LNRIFGEVLGETVVKRGKYLHPVTYGEPVAGVNFDGGNRGVFIVDIDHEHTGG